MAASEIILAGEPILKQVAEPVQQIDKRIVRVLNCLEDTMYAVGGVGLAAPQIGVPLRIIVIDLGDDVLYEMINPVITNAQGSVLVNEGCKSEPKYNGKVRRARFIECEFYDRLGAWQHLAAEGLLAVAIQHEIDHLNGIMFYEKAEQIVPVRGEGGKRYEHE